MVRHPGSDRQQQIMASSTQRANDQSTIAGWPYGRAGTSNHGAVENPAANRLLGRRGSRHPNRSLPCATPANRILADGTAKDGGERPEHTTRVACRQDRRRRSVHRHAGSPLGRPAAAVLSTPTSCLSVACRAGARHSDVTRPRFPSSSAIGDSAVAVTPLEPLSILGICFGRRSRCGRERAVSSSLCAQSLG